MATEYPEYETRVVRKAEVDTKGSPTRKSLKVDELAQSFIDPETRQSIEVGEAIEFKFDNQTEGVNMLKHLMPSVYKVLKWHEKKKSKSQRVVSIEPQGQEDGKAVVWVVRLV